MLRVSSIDGPDPLRLALDRVGDRWSILILREALSGPARFDRLSKALGIAPNILARRLSDLAEAGLLTRRAYQDKPVRFEYAPTPLAHAFAPVLYAFTDFGERAEAMAAASRRPPEPRLQEPRPTLPTGPQALHNDRLGAISLWERRANATIFRLGSTD